MENDIVKLVLEAQCDTRKLNKLIEDFLPFIKRCVSSCRHTKQSQDDALTLAMLTFADCVNAYREDKGSFVSFVQASIRNRLIDDFRIEQKHISRLVPLLDENSEHTSLEVGLSMKEYELQLERVSLQFEIEDLTKILKAWNTSYAELVKISPKQERTRAQCEYIATLILKNEVWRKQFMEKQRMPSKEMCDVYGVSPKVLEKYKKYIAVLCLIQSGDFPMLRTFLPMNRKGGLGDE